MPPIKAGQLYTLPKVAHKVLTCPINGTKLVLSLMHNKDFQHVNSFPIYEIHVGGSIHHVASTVPPIMTTKYQNMA